MNTPSRPLLNGTPDNPNKDDPQGALHRPGGIRDYPLGVSVSLARLCRLKRPRTMHSPVAPASKLCTNRKFSSARHLIDRSHCREIIRQHDGSQASAFELNGDLLRSDLNVAIGAKAAVAGIVGGKLGPSILPQDRSD
jgi:hypothetical protein